MDFETKEVDSEILAQADKDHDIFGLLKDICIRLDKIENYIESKINPIVTPMPAPKTRTYITNPYDLIKHLERNSMNAKHLMKSKEEIE